MQSLLAKISIAALFAANATASMLPEDKVDLALDGSHDLLVEMLENINQNNAAIEKLQSQQVTKDFYYTNPSNIDMPSNRTKTLYTWTIKKGETINFEVKFDTD